MTKIAVQYVRGALLIQYLTATRRGRAGRYRPGCAQLQFEVQHVA